MAYNSTVFGMIRAGIWNGVTIGFKDGNSVKGIMRLVEYDGTQDVLIFERSENVGFEGTNTTLYHVFAEKVNLIGITPMVPTSDDRDIKAINANQKAIEWMKSKVHRNVE